MTMQEILAEIGLLSDNRRRQERLCELLVRLKYELPGRSWTAYAGQLLPFSARQAANYINSFKNSDDYRTVVNSIMEGEKETAQSAPESVIDGPADTK